MKSQVVQTTLLAFTLFTFLAVTPVIGGTDTITLPNGSSVVVPSPDTRGFGDAFERAYIIFRDAFTGCDDNCSTGILWSVTEYMSMVCPVSTNNFTRESLEAIKKDDQLIREGKIQPTPVLLKRRTTPNIAEVSKRHRLLVEWNNAVITCRRRLLAVSSRPLENYFGKLDRFDKQRFVKKFIEKAKLSFDEKNVVINLAGCPIGTLEQVKADTKAEQAKAGQPGDAVQGGCVDDAARNVEGKIMESIHRLPEWLNCPHKWEAGRLVISNISDNVRTIGDTAARRRCLSSYTNAVLCLDFPIDAPLDDKDAARVIWINLSSYYEMAECGFSMLCEMDSMSPGMWDLLLDSPIRYKKALDMRIGRLETKGVPAARFRMDALFSELRDGLQNCEAIIEKGWYPSAKRGMSASQLAEVRSKIKAALGTLPPEIEKDEGNKNAERK